MTNSGIIMGKPNKYSVDQASHYLKRLYFVEREVMRTLGGYLASITNWDLKIQLPRHIWQDSLRADALRSRVLELRYPRRDVDKDHDPLLLTFLLQLSRCLNDFELIEGIYFVTKKALSCAYERYLRETDALDDGPTVEFMRLYSTQINQQIEEINDLYKMLPGFLSDSEEKRQKRRRRQQALQLYLEGIGGVLGFEVNPIELPAPLKERPEFVPPVVPAQDPRFTKVPYHMPPWEPRNFTEDQIRMATSHVNEIWASEVPGLLMWKWNDMPWEFYLDLSRWAYDEARHTLMGAERLRAWGFEIGVDIPLCSEMHSSQVGYGELGLLALLHAFECGAPAGKSQMKHEYEQKGDMASSQDFDYDWADESIHMAYGYKWLLHRIGGNTDQIDVLKEEALGRYYKNLAELQKHWDYQPFKEKIQMKAAEIEAKYGGKLSSKVDPSGTNV